MPLNNKVEEMPRFIQKFFLHVPQRYVVCALCSGALAVCTMDRHTFRINILSHQDFMTRNESRCPPMIGQWQPDSDPAHNAHVFWDENIIQPVSRAFNIGFLVALVPSGMVADACSAKVIICLGLLATSLATLVSPISAHINPIYFITVRFIQGIGQAMVFPSVGSLIVRWVPLTERATSSAVVCLGEYVGYVLSHCISQINKDKSPTSWKTSFYTAGAIGIFYIILWLGLVYDRPATSPFISREEQDLINCSRKRAKVGIRRRPYFPLCSMLSSGPVLSLMAFCCASSWVQYVLLNQFHTYLEQITRITHFVTELIVVSGSSVVVPSTLFWAVVSDCLVNRNYISRTNNRKVLGFVSNMLILPCVLAIPLVECDWRMAGWFYTAAAYFRGIFFSLEFTNALDLTNQHAAVLLSLLNTIASIAAIFSWEFVFTMIHDINNIDQWKAMYVSCIVLLAVMSVPYLFYCSAEVQAWDSRRHFSIIGHSSISSRPSRPPRMSVVKESPSEKSSIVLSSTFQDDPPLVSSDITTV